MPPTPPASHTAATGIDWWGSFPEWLSGLAAIATVGLAIFVPWLRRRRSASRVTFVSERRIDPDGKEFRFYRVHNGGDEPISNVTIFERPIVGDSVSPYRHGVDFTNGLEAGGEWTVEGYRHSQNEVPLVRSVDRYLYFQDRWKKRWLRNEAGTLCVLKEGDPDIPGVVLA